MKNAEAFLYIAEGIIDFMKLHVAQQQVQQNENYNDDETDYDEDLNEDEGFGQSM